MSKMIQGSKLSQTDQRLALAAFVHRHTGDHIAEWAKVKSVGSFHIPNSVRRRGFFPLHFKDDKDWLNNTKFFVARSGDLDRRYHNCLSTPTWPEGV